MQQCKVERDFNIRKGHATESLNAFILLYILDTLGMAYCIDWRCLIFRVMTIFWIVMGFSDLFLADRRTCSGSNEQNQKRRIFVNKVAVEILNGNRHLAFFDHCLLTFALFRAPRRLL